MSHRAAPDRSGLPPILHVEDLARVLGTSVHGAAEACRRGRVPASKLGRRWVIRRDALLRTLRDAEKGHRSPTKAECDTARLLRALPPPRRRRSR